MLWVPVTVAAAMAQVARNSAQASLARRIGTLGATQVRFVFGLPFAAVFLTAALWFGDAAVPSLSRASLAWVTAGALAQIAATALMLAVMQARSFGVAYAYIKAEPVLVAVLGVLLIGDRLPPLSWLAVAVVTVGVVLASTAPRDWRRLLAEHRPVAAGLLGGALFGLSAIAFRAAIGALPSGSFVVRSLTMLVLALAIQTAVLGCWLAMRDRAAFLASLREWRVSLGAGFLGAAASAGWFIAFSLTAAANVRTLALIEMPLAALISRHVSGKSLAAHERWGLAAVMAGLVLLLAPLVP
jgi:drug/metabolite transporter (DMT)-like permease